MHHPRNKRQCGNCDESRGPCREAMRRTDSRRKTKQNEKYDCNRRTLPYCVQSHRRGGPGKLCEHSRESSVVVPQRPRQSGGNGVQLHHASISPSSGFKTSALPSAASTSFSSGAALRMTSLSRSSSSGVISPSPNSESNNRSRESPKKRLSTWRTSERLASCSAMHGL